MEECLGSQHDFKALWRASGCEDMALSDFIPVIIHEDAVPHFSGMIQKMVVKLFQCSKKPIVKRAHPELSCRRCLAHMVRLYGHCLVLEHWVQKR